MRMAAGDTNRLVSVWTVAILYKQVLMFINLQLALVYYFNLAYHKIIRLLAITCPDPTGTILASNQKYSSGSSPTSSTFLSSTLIVCETGYDFQDSSTIKNISCGESALWTPVPACLGFEFFSIYNFILLFLIFFNLKSLVLAS